jgi:transcription elongation factor Elf1
MFKKYFEKRNTFECPNCGHIFTINSFWKWLLRPHLFDIWRFIKCPFCGEWHWMKRIREWAKASCSTCKFKNYAPYDEICARCENYNGWEEL